MQATDNASANGRSLARRDAEGWSVWQVVDRVLQRQPVEVGDSEGRVREVLSGLEQGDRVVRFPSAEDLEGVRVNMEGPYR